MSGYVDYELTVDVDAIVAAAVAQLQTALGVTLNEGDPAVALLEAIALRNAETRLITIDVAAAAFADFGRKIVAVQQIAAAPATVASTWTAVDDSGYVIPAGTRVSYAVSGDQRIGFEVVTETTIAPGDTEATGVELAAIVDGEDANDLAPGTVQLIDPLAWVSSVVTTATTSGGVDAELGTDYLDRLTEELQLLWRVPVSGHQFEIAARRVPGVHRALVRERWDGDSEEGGHVWIAAVDETGTGIDAGVKALLQAELDPDDRRALNHVIHIGDPTYTVVTVDFDAVAKTGYDPADVQARAIAAIETLLSKAVWGGGDQTPPEWVSDPVVRFQDVAYVLRDTEGIDHYTLLTLNGGTADIALTGNAPLPDATVTGDVT